MDHTGQYRGYAPEDSSPGNYPVFISVDPSSGGAGIQNAINTDNNGGKRNGEWLASQPRVCTFFFSFFSLVFLF